MLTYGDIITRQRNLLSGEPKCNINVNQVYELLKENYSYQKAKLVLENWTGFKNEDIKDEQYLLFLKYAKKYNCKVHCLGMTRLKILNKVPFDFVDSSTWKQAGNYGEYRQFIKGKIIINKVKGKYKTIELDKMNFEEFKKMQQYYKIKWK